MLALVSLHFFGRMVRIMSSIVTFEKLYMSVPFEDKDWAKNNGFKFDRMAKAWYLPPGKNPLEFKQYWSYLENTYHDRDELKKRGCRFNSKLKKWYVPSDCQEPYYEFVKWWPESLKQFVFNDKFIIEDYISKTGQSEMFKARSLHDGEFYAIKYFLGDVANFSNDAHRRAIDGEINALRSLEDHPNILEIVEWDQIADSSRFYIVSPWMPLGSLDNYIGRTESEIADLIFSAFKGTYDLNLQDISDDDLDDNLDTETDVWLDEHQIIHGILDGIAHAHANNILHRDIKPGNILLDWVDNEAESANFVPLLCDFGTSKTFSRDTIKESEHTVVGLRTRPYRPEFIASSAQGKKEISHQKTWDLFAWAIVTIELMADRSVDSSEEALEVLDTEIAPKLDQEIVKLIKSALSFNPNLRPHDTDDFREKLNKLTEQRKKRLAWTN